MAVDIGVRLRLSCVGGGVCRSLVSGVFVETDLGSGLCSLECAACSGIW